MHLNLVNQICKLLNSSGDLMRNMNMVLITLEEYLAVRNPMVLIRDNVINKYFIEVAPEISEMEKNLWNRQANKLPSSASRKFQHEMIIYADEAEILDLPAPSGLEKEAVATLIQPVIYQQSGLPLAVLTLMVTKNSDLGTVQKIIRFVADMLSVSMIARGFHTPRISEALQEPEEIPRVIDKIVGKSESLKRQADIIRKVATSKATVLIRGESGTGKELFAQAVHNSGLHRKAPFVSFNCAALSDNLLESELFGHEKGAFTGATTARKGRFELADGGTLFLDEVGDTSLGFQAKILRVLQEGEFERLGSSTTISVDVRVICATNVNLEEAIRQGTFREDLFYRLNVVPLRVPSLRERKEDIPLLVQHFLRQFNQRENKSLVVSERDMERLVQYQWPGNVRELENRIHSACLMEQRGVLFFGDKLDTTALPVATQANVSFSEPVPKTVQDPKTSIVAEETQAIERALEDAKGVQKKAAEMLGITMRQLRYRIKKYNIAVRKIRL